MARKKIEIGKITMFREQVESGVWGKKSISKKALEDALELEPKASQRRLAEMFGTSRPIISRELLRHGLFAHRKFKAIRDISKEDMGNYLKKYPYAGIDELANHFKCTSQVIRTRLELFDLKLVPTVERISVMRSGANNPNFGDKERPWLEGENHPFHKWHKENPNFGENQRGTNNPIHKVMHLYDDPEYVQRITRGIKEHVDDRRGSTYEDVYGEEKAQEYKQKLREASPLRIAKIKNKETEPELITTQILEGCGVSFATQVVIGYYTVDFLVLEHDIVIQADGDFWHANPDLYDDQNLYDLQKKNRRIDASCSSYLENKGYTVLRFWEYDLHNNLDACKKELLSCIGAKK